MGFLSGLVNGMIKESTGYDVKKVTRLVGSKNLLMLGAGAALASIDTAIESTRRLVASFDRVLVELRSSLSDDELATLGQIEQRGRRQAS